MLCSIDQSGKTSLRRWYFSGESSEGSEKATCGGGGREMVPAIAETLRRETTVQFKEHKVDQSC